MALTAARYHPGPTGAIASAAVLPPCSRSDLPPWRAYSTDASEWSPTGQFDLIINSFALPTDRDGQARFFQKARQALAPGGSVLIKDFDASMRRLEEFAPPPSPPTSVSAPWTVVPVGHHRPYSGSISKSAWRNASLNSQFCSPSRK